MYFIEPVPGAGVVNSGFISDTPNTNQSLLIEDTDEDGIPTEVKFCSLFNFAFDVVKMLTSEEIFIKTPKVNQKISVGIIYRPPALGAP